MHIKMRTHHLEKQPKSTIFWQPGFEAVDTSLQQLDIGYLEPWMQREAGKNWKNGQQMKSKLARSYAVKNLANRVFKKRSMKAYKHK